MAKEAGTRAQAQINEVLNLAAERAREYVRDVAERSVGPSQLAVTALAELHEPFPSSPSDPCEALGLPSECAGGLVTCATMANFTALATARYALLARAGWDVTADGMFGAPPIEVVVGAEVHASILKALSLAGFGRKRVTIVEADGQGRMRADKLPRLSERTIVCIQAGNVNTGSFDPAVEICKAAREQGAWVHVDGAFGLWARISPAYEHLTRGFDRADSWATDAHKWPNVGYDSGIAIVRDGSALRASMGITT